VPLEFNYAAKLGISKSALQLIPNGIPIHTVNFDEIYARRTNLAVTPTLGFVGRLVYQKNPLLFIEVLNEVIKGGCEAKAILLGEGPLRAEMKKLAEGYGIAERIEWRGEAPAGLSYPEMDVMVHTSLYEALPYSLLEASAALLPIVATSNPGSRAILGQLLPDNLVAEPNAKLIAAKVLLILQNDSLRLEQMRLLEEIAQQYSTETMLLRYKQLYDSLLANIA
jgi:glycosyltransferase involved in cell wall biosynthesis